MNDLHAHPTTSPAREPARGGREAFTVTFVDAGHPVPFSARAKRLLKVALRSFGLRAEWPAAAAAVNAGGRSGVEVAEGPVGAGAGLDLRAAARGQRE